MGKLRAKLCAAGPQQAEEVDRAPRHSPKCFTRTRMLSSLPTPPSLPQHPHAATINLSPTCGPVAPRADPMPRLTRAVQRDTCHPGWDDVGFGQLQQT